jgi:prepilin-type N-terminal cleavage/methylation domain-containing protein
MTTQNLKTRTLQRRSKSAGFTLMELLVAMAVFTVISVAAFQLVNRHAPLYNTQQMQAALNVSMRNAATQLQIDAVNAGSGYYTGANVPAWPVGLTINNRPATTTCYDSTTNTYANTCFDELNIIVADPSTPVGRPSSANTGQAGCLTSAQNINTSGAGTMTIYVNPVMATAPTAAQLTAYANNFKANDQILLITQDGQRLTTSKLISDGQVNGSSVKLVINQTQASGAMTTASASGPGANDPIGVTDVQDSTSELGSAFACSSDFVLKLATVKYWVDAATEPANPKLIREQGGVQNPVAEQIIGFKVGAYVIDGTATDDTDYNFDRPSMGTKYKWGAVRSIKVSLIGRTPPNPNNTFRNSFDLGPYRVEAISVVVNPRNLSMND